MKKITPLIASALLLLLGACASEDRPDLAQGQGAINLSVNTDGGVIDAIPATRASQATVVPEADELAIELTKSDGTFSKKWDKISDFPADQPFTVGQYTATASWGNPEDEGFDKPYYYGSANLNVEEGNTTEATINASLANTMLSVTYTDAFRNYFKQYSTQAHSEGGDFITFLSDEERPAYLRPGNVKLTVSITKQNGVSATIEPAEFEALARHHYHVTFDVNNSQTGEAQLAVIFDDSIVSEDVTVDLSDDVLSAPAPMVTAKGFTPGIPLEVMEYQAPAQPAKMTFSAPGGLRTVTLTTQSPALLAKGFPAEIDLLAANESQQALLTALGLTTQGLWKNPDKIGSIDFTNVCKNIAGAGTHSFALVVKDKLGKVNLPVILEVTSYGVEMSVAGSPSAHISDTQATFTLSSNGPDDAMKDIIVELYNYGAWSQAQVVSSAVAASSRMRAPSAAKNYNVTVKIPASTADQQMRIKYKGAVRSEATIQKHGATLELESDARVFATSATFKVHHSSHTSLSALNFFVCGAVAGSYTRMSDISIDQANSRVTIKGLSAGTSYTAKCDESTDASQALAPVSFKTEAATQLPNSDMEAWCTAGDSGSHWSTYYAGASQSAAVWGTNNPMTTSQGGNFAYVRVSGTKPSTDKHGGSNAACISTQGWGSGNSAVGTMSGACKYIDAGLLHLGASRTARPAGYSDGVLAGPLNTNDLNCGIAFASRPSAVTFWYKYAAKNSADTGIATAYVYDASGNIIASGSLALGSQGSYVQKSIPLTYADGAPKAAKIYVCFMSTNNANALKKDSSWLTPPPFGGSAGSAEYYGSRLYIDDIALSY